MRSRFWEWNMFATTPWKPPLNLCHWYLVVLAHLGAGFCLGVGCLVRGFIPQQQSIYQLVLHHSPFISSFCLWELSWQDVLGRLREIEKLLKRPMQRERFIAKCLPANRGDIESLFSSWNTSLKSLRWEQIVNFIGKDPWSIVVV